ncbi:MAG: sigma factor [Chitinophagaceae bacterium]
MNHSFSYIERDLPKEIAAGNAEAFTQLYDQYHQRIYNLALHITRTELIAEDLVQDVFIKVWEKRAGLSAVDNINAWLY